MSAAILRGATAGTIVAYQRYVSPLPGALWQGLPRQFARCKAAYAVLAATGPEESEKRKRDKKGGWRDAACDCPGHMCSNVTDLPCHMPKSGLSCDLPGACDIGPCDCSW